MSQPSIASAPHGAAAHTPWPTASSWHPLLGAWSGHSWTAEAMRAQPAFTLADLDRCKTRRRRDATLSKCFNLAVAGAASKSLATRVARYSKLSHHFHHWTHTTVQAKHENHSKWPTCIVVSLRDPATRLESAWRFQVAGHGRMRQWLRGQCVTPHKSMDNTRLAFLIMRYREAQNECLKAMYNSSVVSPKWGKTGIGGHGDGPLGGDNFMVPQLHYLNDLNCSHEATPEIHFVCTERFDEDWQKVLRRFGQSEPSSNSSVDHARSDSAHPKRMYLSTLSAADRSFVRDQMYPLDTALHSYFCGSSASDG